MKKIFYLFSSFCFASIAALIFGLNAQPIQAQSLPATLQFRQDLLSKEGETYSLPIYLNTNGQAANAVEIKINSTGNLDLLSLHISGPLEKQEVYSYVKDGKAYLSFTAANITAGLKTTAPQEVALLQFIAFDETTLNFAFDQDKTMVVNAATDDNFLATYDSISLTATSAQSTTKTSLDNSATTEVDNETSETSETNVNSTVGANNFNTGNDTTIMSNRPAEYLDKEESRLPENGDSGNPSLSPAANSNQKLNTSGKAPATEPVAEKAPVAQTQIILIVLIVAVLGALGVGLFLLWKNKKQPASSPTMSADLSSPLPNSPVNPPNTSPTPSSTPLTQSGPESNLPLNEKLGQEPWSN